MREGRGANGRFDEREVVETGSGGGEERGVGGCWGGGDDGDAEVGGGEGAGEGEAGPAGADDEDVAAWVGRIGHGD